MSIFTNRNDIKHGVKYSDFFSLNIKTKIYVGSLSTLPIFHPCVIWTFPSDPRPSWFRISRLPVLLIQCSLASETWFPCLPPPSLIIAPFSLRDLYLHRGGHLEEWMGRIEDSSVFARWVEALWGHPQCLLQPCRTSGKARTESGDKVNGEALQPEVKNRQKEWGEEGRRYSGRKGERNPENQSGSWHSCFLTEQMGSQGIKRARKPPGRNKQEQEEVD